MNDRTCNVEKCNSPRSARGMCNLHYQRHIHGRLLIQAPKIIHETCTAEGCELAPRSRLAELCPKHYHRLYRYGTLELTTDQVARGEREPARAPDGFVGQRYGTLTLTTRIDGQWLCRCDCGQTRTASTGDLNRTGDNNTCGVKANHLAEFVDYSGAHDRVRRLYGPASDHYCIGCGAPAQHWSYDHADPDELISPTLGLAYSLDVDHYQARCVPCHKIFDLAHLNSTPLEHLAT